MGRRKGDRTIHEEKRKAIIRDLENGWSRKQIAEHHQVSGTTVHYIDTKRRADARAMVEKFKREQGID